MRHRWVRIAGVGTLLAASSAAIAVPAAARDDGHGVNRLKHLVVIYEENHSFDNLLGGWPGVNGLSSADYQHTVQVGLSEEG